MDKFLSQLKQELESLSQSYLIHVAREDFGIENYEEYTRQELIERCLLVETENAFH